MSGSYPLWSDGRRSTLLGGLLLLAVLLYCDTLWNGFVFDDHFQLEQNPYIESFKYVGHVLTTTSWSFKGAEGATNYYRPLMTIGFLVCNKLFQSLPFGFHLANVLLNCVVVWLVFLTCSLLVQDDVVALAAAVIFALHPIHSEVVAWIVSVNELELAIFYLAAFIFFLRLTSSPPTQRLTNQILMCACFVLALLSKEQAVTLTALATVYEHFYRSDRGSTSWKSKASRYGPLWLIAAVYLAFRITVLGALAPVRQHTDVTWFQAFLSAFALAGQYVSMLFWPHPLVLFHIFHKSEAWSDPHVVAGIGVCALAVVLFVYLWKHARNYSFALIWFALTLAPVMNAHWMAANVFAERYLFLPSVGFCALLAGGFVFLFRQLRGHRQLWQWVLATVAASVLLLAAGEIVARNRDWHDDLTLLTQTLAIEPRASYMRTNLGVLEWDAHNPAEAERQWRLALADAPNNAVAASDLGLAMLEKNRYSDAENYLHRAIELRPNFAAPHLHLARVYDAENDKASAEAELRRAVEIYPFSTQSRNALGQFYFDAGNLAQAEVQFRASVDDLPNTDAWDRLGDIYMREGLTVKAEQAWRQALELSGFDTHAHRSLGNLYFANGQDAEAEKQYRSVLVFDPNDPDALRALRKLHPQEFPVVLH